jgi:hypothetical protein
VTPARRAPARGALVRLTTLAVALVVALLACALLSVARPIDAGAATDGGARSTVVGRGDIVTSILGWSRPSRTMWRPTPVPRCRWRTLNDAQLEWLVSISAQSVALGLGTPLLDPLAGVLDRAELPDGDLQGFACGTETFELRFVERTTPRSAQEVLMRQMITRLPVPEPVLSPPPSADLPVGQPVFVSIDDAGWAPVQGSLSFNGITAEVVAEPVGLRVVTGDPAASTATCSGPGRPYAPGGPPVSTQARHPEACTVTYRSATTAPATSTSATSGAAAGTRPDRWLGTVTVLWAARWRVGQGPWAELGTIPRTRLIARTVRELTTSVETPD